MLDEYKVSVPEGVSGDWSIQKFEVGGGGISNIRNRISAITTGRYVPDGDYTRLKYKKTLVMSDTPDEIRDHLGIIHESKGNVLLVGLGLGVVLQAVAKKEEVIHIDVIEKSQDVLDLVQGHYVNMFPGKITFIQADIFEWKPDKHDYWDCVWFDIWNDLCTDNLDEMATLHRKFGRKARWKGSWGKSFLRYQRDREKRNSWRY